MRLELYSSARCGFPAEQTNVIFIVGGRGLVGSGFTRYCEQAGEPHAVIHRQNYSSFAGKSCDLLINANGNSSKRLADQSPVEDFNASVRTVRASLLDFHYRRYVHVSSCDVYPDCSSPDLTRESQSLDPARQSPYGFHKYLAEQCVQHGPGDWLIFRCGGFVGPGMKKNAIYDILRGGPLYLDPESELQFLETDSAAEIVFSLIGKGVRNKIFNLCGRGVVRLQEVVEAAGKDVVVEPDSPRVRYDVNIEKISSLVDVPQTKPAVCEFVRRQLAASSRST